MLQRILVAVVGIPLLLFVLILARIRPADRNQLQRLRRHFKSGQMRQRLLDDDADRSVRVQHERQDDRLQRGHVVGQVDDRTLVVLPVLPAPADGQNE